MISICDSLGGPEFQRVRLGIGKPAQRSAVERYVLEPFTESELRILPRIIVTARSAILEVISSGIKTAMNSYNGMVINDLIQEV